MAFTPIVSYQTVTSETVSSGTQSIVNGGIASCTIISSGGSQLISSGGSASNTAIYGVQCISYGGTAIYTTYIASGGSQIVFSGGSAIATYINGGDQIVFSGGIAKLITIISGEQYVGGVANSTTISSGGIQLISSGGVANSTTIYSGSQLISYDGIANSTTISSGGLQAVSSDGVANFTTIYFSGTQYVSSGGIANSTTISGGNQLISSGGVANSTTIFYGGNQLISSGGVANSTTISSSGSQTISSGGSANIINQQSSAAIIADTGATITGGTNTRADGYSTFSIANGVASNFLLQQGGRLIVLSGHFAINTLIASTGNQLISSGGVANSTTISSGGIQLISSGGVANSTTIFSYGSQNVLSGGSANVIIQQSNGAIIADTGAIITGGTNTRTDGHSAFSIVNGVASNFLLEKSGSLSVLSGNSAIDTLISSGTQNISSGGVAQYTIIRGYGSLIVSSGGVANSTTISSGGIQLISSGGVTNSTTIFSYGSQNVLSGGSANVIIQQSNGAIIADTGATITAGTNTRTDGHNAFSLVNGVASNFFLANGGCLSILSGHSAIDTYINGGVQRISSGGTADNTTINSFGSQVVSSGGVAGKTVISYFGSQYIFSGGTAINTIITGGYQEVAYGAVANSTTISSGGSQGVGSGGVANSATINSGGSQGVGSGGVANSATINSGGRQMVGSCGVANSTTVNSGGSLYIYGGTASLINQQAGGIIQTDTGATISGGTNTRTDGHNIFSLINGTASNFLLENGGYLAVLSNFSAIDTVIASGGKLYLSAGGCAAGLSQQAGAAIITNTGATITGGKNTRTDGHSSFSLVNGIASNFLLEKGMSLSILSGHSAIDTLIASGGTQYISSGTTANYTTIDYGGLQYVSSGGVVNFTTINSGGVQCISSGCTANFATINSGGSQWVYSGSAVSSTTINVGGFQWVAPGSVVSATTINSGGSQWIYSGSIANVINQQTGAAIKTDTGATITGGINTRTDGHSAFSIVNGIASNFLLDKFGSLSVSSGHSAIDTVIASGGKMFIISSGGTANIINQQAGAAIIADTSATITSGTNVHSAFSLINGVASNFLLENGGELFVLSGHSAINTVVASGGNLYALSYGKVNVIIQLAGGAVGGRTDATITSGINTRTDGHSAFSIVSRTASNFLLENGGELDVGDSAIDTVIVSGGIQYAYGGGVASLTTIYSGGVQYLNRNGTANSTTINSGGLQWINDSGVASNTIINYLGQQNISSGGMANSTTINWGGRQVISNYSCANNTTINSGGSQVVYYGTANSTIINYGGNQYASSGSVANSTIINFGGTQNIYFRGTANSTTINSGGNIEVWSSGTANNTTVNSGGSIYVSSGGKISGILLVNGGHVVLDNAASVNSLTTVSYSLATANIDDMLFTVNSGALGAGTTAYSLNLDNAATGTYILASGADLSGMNSKNFTITYNSQNVNLQVGSSYVFANGNKLSLNFTDAATDQLTAIISVIDITPPTVPSNLKPTVTGSNVVLDWADATDSTSGVKQYEIQVDNNNNFSSPEYSASASASNMDITGVTDGIYFWRVRAQDNADNYSSWTGGSSFTVDITAPAVPAALTRTVTGSSIVIDWADATDTTSGVKQYEFQIDNNSDFSSNEKSGAVTSSNANVTGLADENYYWRVRTQDNSGNYSAWSNGSNFIVDITAPSIPAALTRAVTDSSVAFGWVDATDATSGVKQYEVQVDNNNNFSSPEYSAPSASSSATLSGMTDGNYYWRVRTQDNSDNYSAWSIGSSFTVDTAAPSIPAALTRVVAGSNVVFDWIDSTDATSGVKQYDIQLDDNSDFSSPVNTFTPAASTTNVTNMSDGNYYWRVRSQDNSGNYSGWKTGDIFMIDTTAPTLLSSLTRTVTGKNVTLDWNDASDATSGVKQYDVQIDNNSNFSSPEFSKQITSSQTPVENLAPGTYYWRVRTQDNSGNWSVWNAGADFTIDLTPPAVPGGLKQTISGNSVAFDWNDSTDASGIKQYEIRVDNNSNFSSPEYSTVVDASAASTSLALGTYYWQVRAQDKSSNYSAWSSSSKFVVTPMDTGANTWQTANDIANLDNWVGYGDSADFYKLTMANAGTLALGLTGLNGNADLSLLNSAGTAIKTSSNAGVTPEAIANVLLLAGTYYVKVAAGTSVIDATYSLTNTIKYCPTDKAANDYKTAQDISTLDNWVGFGDSADFYKLTMENAGTLTLGLTGLTGNADLSLLNAAGTVLKSSSNTGITPEAINNIALLAGTYYVKVAAGYGGNDASYALSNTIKYCPADKAANDYKTSQDISILDNWVGFGDASDVYKITMTNAGTLTLGLTGLSGNADLALLSSTGMTLKTSAKIGTADETIANVALLAGTYYVKVAAGFGANDASYSLSNTIKYCPTDKAANDYKTALDISNLDSWLGFGDASDVYKVTMTNAGTLTLGLTGLTGNADLSLLSSTGMTLKSSAKTGTADEAINSVSLLAGTYYVKIAAGFGVNDASYTLSNTINYFPGDTNDKAGNTIDAAKLIDVPPQTGWVGFGDTDDYYRFDLAAAAQGMLRLYDMAGGNADLTLYDAKGVQLQKSAKTGALEDTITRNLAAGTYYARVNAVSGNIDYKLDFSNKDAVGMLAS